MHLFILWHLSPVLYVLCKSVNFIEFLMDFGISDDILDTTLITDKKLLHFKPSQLGQILCVNTGFSQARHKYRFITLQF